MTGRTDDTHPTTDIRDRMRAGLTSAIKSKDRLTISALRSALGALDNAEAIDVADVAYVAYVADVADGPMRGDSPIALATTGVGSTDATRRALTAADIADVLRAEIDERRTAADQYDGVGQHERAAALRAEVDVLAVYAG